MFLIYSLGSNSGGQLGTGDTEDLHYLTQTMALEEGGWQITGGGNHTVVWSPNSCSVWVCGSNQDSQIFVKEESVLEWQHHEMDEEVREVACGWNHTVVVMESGSVRCFGSNKFKQLDSRDLPSAQYTRVACGMRHSMALDTEGRVHGWGTNRHNQLGTDNHLLPAMSMVACGRHHSAAISKDQQWVYVSGQNRYRQHGTSSADGCWSKWELPAKATKLCCGWEFTAVLMEDHRVAMWGRSDHGQLGSESNQRAYIELPGGIRDISCGSNHTAAITHTGAVYMWGWNEHGNAGDPTLKDIWEPRQITAGAKQIGTGYGNTFIAFE